eukprot:CAMPEP_0168607372 /NCGR_PEP_ID=MMETSP0420-20121227/17103_1 /TAXON_ID=498008 /ORGANISM="Pessonella sp." /LENGTH=880 /DNA_ID=CAMNT_0008647167 /DNA_START=210 /DNA_END=2852 /DNA_ORIENTATION=+
MTSSTIISYDAVGADAYGGGQLDGPLRINGRKFVCNSSDISDCTEAVSTRRSQPYVLILLDDGTACGVFFDSNYKCLVDLESSGKLVFNVDLSDSESLHPAHVRKWTVNVYRLFGGHPIRCNYALSKLTGFAPLPPLWALGFHQSKDSYESHDELLDIANEFRQRDIPCDALWIGVGHTDNGRAFTYCSKRFPDPRATATSLRAVGFRSVWHVSDALSTMGHVFDSDIDFDERKLSSSSRSSSSPLVQRKKAASNLPKPSKSSSEPLLRDEIEELMIAQDDGGKQLTELFNATRNADTLASVIDALKRAPLPPSPRPARPTAVPAITDLDESLTASEEDSDRLRGLLPGAKEGDHLLYSNQRMTKPFLGASFSAQRYVFPDFSRNDTRQWWAMEIARFVSRGGDGLWHEGMPLSLPSSLSSSSLAARSLAMAWHRGNTEQESCCHAAVRSAHTTLAMKATLDGIRRATTARRPFILSPPGIIGQQRYSATHCGLHPSTPRHLRWAIPAAVRSGLCGQPFAAVDIGGHTGPFTARLYVRWAAIGALLPLARAHSTSACEPWNFDDHTIKTVRAAIARRYRMLPTLYSAFREAHKIGAPVVRPLFFADPCDPALRDADSGFLLGEDVLVATPRHYFTETVTQSQSNDNTSQPSSRRASFNTNPNVSTKSSSRGFDTPRRSSDPIVQKDEPLDQRVLRDSHGTPLPGGASQWMLLDDVVDDGIDMHDASVAELPLLYARRGACIALGPLVRSTSELTSKEKITDVVVALAGHPGAMAVGVFYEDDGDGYAHQRSGTYREVTYHAAVLDSLDHVVVQRRVTGGGAGFGLFGRVRVLCCVGSEQTAIGIINEGDDFLEFELNANVNPNNNINDNNDSSPEYNSSE